MILSILLAAALSTSPDTTVVSKKKSLFYFHTSWCGWCKYMDKNILSDSAIKLTMDSSYTTYKVDCGSDNKIVVDGVSTTERNVCASHRVHSFPQFEIWNGKKKIKSMVGAANSKAEFKKFLK